MESANQLPDARFRDESAQKASGPLPNFDANSNMVSSSRNAFRNSSVAHVGGGARNRHPAVHKTPQAASLDKTG
jgi:hypothetical protein